MNNFCSLPMPCLDGRAYPYLWYLKYCISIWSCPFVIYFSIYILERWCTLYQMTSVKSKAR